MLVVDDNPIAGKVLVRTMEALGWQACYVGDGQQAVQRVAAAAQDREPYDVVFMDWRLPDQDGVLTARQIRDHAACAGRPPAIIMSRYSGKVMSVIVETASAKLSPSVEKIFDRK